MTLSELIADMEEIKVRYGDPIVCMNNGDVFADPEAWMMSDDILCLSTDEQGWSAPKATQPVLRVVK